MRILTIVSDLGRGGTQQVAFNYALGYSKSGINSAVFAYSKSGHREDILNKENITVFVADGTLDSIDKVLREILLWKPEFVHIHRDGFYCKQTNFIISYLRNSVKLIVETNIFARVDYSESSKYIDIHFQLSKWCLWKWSYLSKNISPTPLGIVIPNSVVIENYFKVNYNLINSFKGKYHIPSNGFLFGRIGQPIESKWSIVIFEAFSSIAMTNKNAYLILVGCPEKYIKFAETLPAVISNRIIFISFLQDLDEIKTFYSSIDVFLHASDIGESFGMVLAEALLCECPVITLSTPLKDNSQSEVVGPGGIVVFNREEMIKAMNLLSHDVLLRGKMSKTGRKNIIHNFSNEIVVKRIVEIFSLSQSTKTIQKFKQSLKCGPYITNLPKNFLMKELNNLPFYKKLFYVFSIKFIYYPSIYKSYIKLKKYIYG